jgi:hypothetical protein
MKNRAVSLVGLICLLAVTAARAGLVANPSFEENYNATWPHYGPINGWTGGSGTNRADGPFHNGGTPVTDGQQMAFIQGSLTMSQGISGLIPGQSYWIQYFYDSRNGSLIDLTTKWDDVPLDTVSAVLPGTGGASYRFRNVVFTPTAAEGTLAFTTLSTGDSTGLFDGVCLVPRNPGQIVVMNPSFEASGTPPAPGTLTAAAGWTGAGTGSAGVNDAVGPFADNGLIPEQDHAAFLQSDLTISQTLRGLAVGETYAVAFRYNARTGNTPRLNVSVDGTSIFDQDVAPVGGVLAYRTGSANFTAAATTAVLSLAQTAAGDQTVLLDDIQVTGVVVEPIPNLKVGPSTVEVGPGTRGRASFTVSGKRLESGPSTVTVRIINEGVARFVDADLNGVVTLTFPQGAADTTLTTEIEGVSRGTTTMVIEDNGGHDGVDGTIVIEGVTSFVRNASFESTGPNPGIGAGVIMAWDNNLASSGINNNTMPFFDNGLVPDRGQVAYLQGSQVLSQPVKGLVSGQRYWLQAYYNARGCCGGTMDFQVRFNGTELAAIAGVVPSGAGQPFSFLNAAFTATAAEALLEFSAAAVGDASLLLDAICIVPVSDGEMVVKNPSFESSGSPAGAGYIGQVAGWTTTGGHGINVDTVGPFSDNGLAGAQDRVAFLQGPSSLSQILEGLTAGSPYTLTYLVNARNGDTVGPTPYRVLIDSVEVLTESQDPVGPGNPYARKTITFTAAGTAAEVKFEGLATGAVTDDHSLLLDDVHLFAGTGTGGNVLLQITPLAGNSVDIAWPVSSPANLLLQSTTNVAVGPWITIDAVPFVDGGLNHVLDVIDAQKKFYRLARP